MHLASLMALEKPLNLWPFLKNLKNRIIITIATITIITLNLLGNREEEESALSHLTDVIISITITEICKVKCSCEK